MLKTKIKTVLRTYAPSDLYAYIYRTFQKYNHHGLTDSKINAYSQFTKKGFYPFKLENVTFPILLDPRNGGVDSEIFSDGSYEPAILTIIQNSLSKDSVFVDIGSNIGQHSLYTSRFCNHVFAFEPIKRIYDQFNASIFKNDILNISAFNYALGNVAQSISIYGNEMNMGASSIVVHENRSKIQDIKVLRLDDVYKKIGIESAHFVKIDVEGYELDVLLGAANFLKEYQPTILIEFSPYLYNKVDKHIGSKILQLILDLGYTITDIGADTGVSSAIVSKDQLADIDQTNLLCIPSIARN